MKTKEVISEASAGLNRGLSLLCLSFFLELLQFFKLFSLSLSLFQRSVRGLWGDG